MPFVELTQVGPRKNVLGGSQNRTNLFATAMCNKSAMRNFAELFCTHFNIFVVLLSLYAALTDDNKRYIINEVSP